MNIKKVNIVIFSILVIIVFFYYLFWGFISSPFFAKVATRIVNESIPEDLKDSIAFKKVTIGNFPPRLIIEDVEVSIEEMFGLEELRLQISELHVGVNIFSSYRDKVSLSNIELLNGYLYVKTKESQGQDTKKNEKEESIENIMQKLQSFVVKNLKGFDLGEVFISRIELQKMYIDIESLGKAYTVSTAIESYKEKIYTEANIESIEAKIAGIKPISSLVLKGKMDKTSYKVDHFKVSQGASVISVKGDIKNPFSAKRRQFVAKFAGEVVPNEIMEEGILKELEVEGVTKFHGELFGRETVERVNSVNVFNDFRSKFFTMDKGVANISYQDHKVFIDKVSFQRNGGEVFLKNKVQVFDTKSKHLLDDVMKLKVVNLPVEDGLKSIPPVAGSLKGEITGEIDLLINENRVEVDIFDGAYIEALALKGSEKEIVKVDKASFKKSVFSFNLKKEKLEIDSALSIGGKDIQVKGYLTDNDISIESDSFYIDLKHFEHVAGEPIEGYGKAEIKTLGSLKKPLIEISFDLNDFYYADFYAGRVKGESQVDIENEVINYKDINGSVGRGRYSARATLDFKKNEVNARFRFENFSIDEFKESHYPLIEEISDDYWNSVSGIISGDYLIKGKPNLKGLEVDGIYLSNDMTFFNERLSSVRTSFKVRKEVAHFEDINMRLGSGRVFGEYTFDKPKGISSYQISSEDITTKDFGYYLSHGLGFSSDVDFSIKGSSQGGVNALEAKVILENSKIGNTEVPASNISFKIDRNILKFSGEYLDKVVSFKGGIDFNSKRYEKNTNLNIEWNVDHWSYILNLISSYDLEDPFLQGSLVGGVDLNFNINDWERMNLVGKINNLSFDHPLINIRSQNEGVFDVRNGKILKWGLKVQGGAEEEFLTKGRGDFTDKFLITFQSKMNLRKVNRVLSSFFNTKGLISLNGKFEGSGKKERSFKASLKGQNVSLSKIGWYTSLNDTFFNIEYQDFQFDIKEFSSKLGNGDLKILGQVNWRSLYPEVKVSYSLDDAIINIHDRSYLVTNGRGSIIGDNAPYAVSGDIRISGGEVFNEFSSFTGKGGVQIEQSNQYTPKEEAKEETNWVAFNLNSIIDKEIWVRNSMVDFKLLGNLSISGTTRSPILFGRIQSNLDKENKVVIRNNQLYVNKLILSFNGDKDYANPLVDFSSGMMISDYKVSVEAYGPAKNLAIDFSSDPYLDRQSILSLLAFGYAEQINERLSEQDRDSLSSAGVGSFIFNQLKINEALKDNLGITLNVDTEFEQDEESLLQGRSQTGGGGGEVRSATTVEINKKVTDNVNLSVSSSITGSIGQKQKMNINYNVSDNVSLEGIYEIKTDEDGEENNSGSDSSIGTDLKFRWTFK